MRVRARAHGRMLIGNLLRHLYAVLPWPVAICVLIIEPRCTMLYKERTCTIRFSPASVVIEKNHIYIRADALKVSSNSCKFINLPCEPRIERLLRCRHLFCTKIPFDAAREFHIRSRPGPRKRNSYCPVISDYSRQSSNYRKQINAHVLICDDALICPVLLETFRVSEGIAEVLFLFVESIVSCISSSRACTNVTMAVRWRFVPAPIEISAFITENKGTHICLRASSAWPSPPTPRFIIPRRFY